MFARETTGKLGTFNPGFNSRPFNEDYRSKGTVSQLPLGYDTSRGPLEIHHVMGLQDQLRPLIQGLSENEQIGIMNRLISNGVNLGNDPNNLIALLKPDHRAVHRRMEEVGLDSNNEKEKVIFLNKVARLPYKDRLVAADVFAEQIYPGIIEQMHLLGHKVPTQSENIARYNQAVLEEKQGENQNYIREVLKGLYGEKPTIGNINKVVKAPMPDFAQAYKDGYVEGIQGVMASEEGAGDNRPKSMVFNNTGDVVIGGPARVNGNGKKPH